MRKLAYLLLVVALAAGGWWAWRQQEAAALPDYIATSNGRLEMNRIDVATLYPGRIKTVHVNEGDEVAKDAVLVELSSDQSAGQLAAARAATEGAEDTVQRAQAGIKQAKQTVARAEAEIAAYRQQQKVAKLELDNARQMRRDNLISASEYNKREAD